MTTPNDETKKGPALVFGASGEQGHAVVEGFLDFGYFPVYGVTRQKHDPFLEALDGAALCEGNVASTADVERILLETKAQAIFLVTTTEMPTGVGQTSGFRDAMEEEYQVIVRFFETLTKVHQQDGIERHVVLSTFDNVQTMCEDIFEMTGTTWINPLDDGAIVPHYSGKGRAGEDATKMLEHIEGLSLTLLTLPFLHSNFLGFFAPLPNDGRTQWMISACFGDHNSIDMLSSADLGYIVPQVIEEYQIYDGKNVRLSAEKLSMDEVAALFSDLFGKDVIYNPLSPEELSTLPIPAAACMAQMCQFIGDPRSLAHDVDVTEAVMFPRKPRMFKDWLLVNSDHPAFERVGLSVDAAEIKSVAVFGATSLQGVSVIKGLLADTRKEYTIRATTRHLDSEAAKALVELDPKRVELVYADFDDVESCKAAVESVDGAFLVTDFVEDTKMDMDTEERHTKNIIDACEASHSVRHLVFSTMESAARMHKKMKQGSQTYLEGDNIDEFAKLDRKAKAAAYARTKKLSVTYIIMPYYSEQFVELLKPTRRVDDAGKETMVISVPMKDDTKVMCMSVEDLGPAVANIFDSYQVYAGHEIGLVTDFVSVSEVVDIIKEVLSPQDGDEFEVETVEEDVDVKEWIEAKDTYMKDFGQMFRYMSHTDVVQKRRAIAKTLDLVPNARPLRKWVEQNKDNLDFREKLGLR